LNTDMQYHFASVQYVA